MGSSILDLVETEQVWTSGNKHAEQNIFSHLHLRSKWVFFLQWVQRGILLSGLLNVDNSFLRGLDHNLDYSGPTAALTVLSERARTGAGAGLGDSKATGVG